VRKGLLWKEVEEERTNLSGTERKNWRKFGIAPTVSVESFTENDRCNRLFSKRKIPTTR